MAGRGKTGWFLLPAQRGARPGSKENP